MRDDPNPTMPQPHVLAALCQPRLPQLGDQCVRALFGRWRKLGFPIEYADLNRVADLLGVTRPDAKTRRKIVAAVEAAGIEIRNYDSLREWVAEHNAHVSLTGDAMFGIVEEARWRRPEEWDARPSRGPSLPPAWLVEWYLDREYGPTPERALWQEKRRTAGPLWFLSEDQRRSIELAHNRREG
jgi:hypothetical protein